MPLAGMATSPQDSELSRAPRQDLDGDGRNGTGRRCCRRVLSEILSCTRLYCMAAKLELEYSQITIITASGSRAPPPPKTSMESKSQTIPWRFC